MKRIFFIIALILFVNLSYIFACEIIVRISDVNYPPMFIQTNEGKWCGLSIELAEVLLKEADCTPVYEGLTFQRGLNYIEQGKIDMMLNLTRTEEREKFIYFIGPQHFEKVILVVPKKSNFVINNLDDLKKLPLNIGTDKGIYYGTDFEKKINEDPEFKQKFEDVPDVMSNAKKLEFNRISAFINNQPNIVYLIKRNPLFYNFKIHSFIIYQNLVYFGFSKRSISKEQLAAYQEAYNRANKNELFQVVKKKYGIE